MEWSRGYPHGGGWIGLDPEHEERERERERGRGTKRRQQRDRSTAGERPGAAAGGPSGPSVRRVSTRVPTSLSFPVPHHSTTTQRSQPSALFKLGLTQLHVANPLPLVASDMSARHTRPERPRLPSFDHAVEAIVLGLGDPPAVPVACLTALNICYDTVLTTLSKKAREYYGPVHSKTLRPRERDRPLLVQTMRFLATSRTTEQWRALSGAIAPECCFCVSAPTVVQTVPHEPSLMNDPNTLGTLVYNMCFLYTQ
jgi:hypothetical protein